MRKDIELAFAIFICFHDWYKNDTKKPRKNDKCMEALINKIIKIAYNHKKYPFWEDTYILKDL